MRLIEAAKIMATLLGWNETAQDEWHDANPGKLDEAEAAIKAVEKARPDTCAHWIAPQFSDAILKAGYWCPCCGDLLTWDEIQKARAHRGMSMDDAQQIRRNQAERRRRTIREPR